MRSHGHRYQIVAKPKNHAKSQLSEPTRMSRDEYLEHARVLLTRSRVRELPGTFNPLLIADLFHEQCTPWRSIALQYVESLWSATRAFLETVFGYLTQERIADLLMREVIDPIMQHRLISMCDRVDSILDQYKSGHPITYNHYFTETIQSMRNKRVEDDLTQRLRDFLGARDDEALEELNFVKLKKSSLISALSSKHEFDMDRYACGEAVDCMFAFYKVAMKNAVDNISTQCWEEILIKPSPDVLTPGTIIEMSAADVSRIAHEPTIDIERRASLATTIRMLEIGVETCRRHVKFRPPGRDRGDSLGQTRSHSPLRKIESDASCQASPDMPHQKVQTQGELSVSNIPSPPKQPTSLHQPPQSDTYTYASAPPAVEDIVSGAHGLPKKKKKTKNME